MTTIRLDNTCVSSTEAATKGLQAFLGSIISSTSTNTIAIETLGNTVDDLYLKLSDEIQRNKRDLDSGIKSLDEDVSLSSKGILELEQRVEEMFNVMESGLTVLNAQNVTNESSYEQLNKRLTAIEKHYKSSEVEHKTIEYMRGELQKKYELDLKQSYLLEESEKRIASLETTLRSNNDKLRAELMSYLDKHYSKISVLEDTITNSNSNSETCHSKIKSLEENLVNFKQNLYTIVPYEKTGKKYKKRKPTKRELDERVLILERAVQAIKLELQELK